jgi:hypothetical protein
MMGMKTLGGYYLGCAMTTSSYSTHIDLINDYSRVSEMNHLIPPQCFNSKNQGIKKENLIIIDPDIISDYSPEHELELLIPDGYIVIYARNIPSYQMPLLLQRAKIVIDLALPGPERLSGEGILMGAIPIISNRWNGASYNDFPMIRKVDHQNITDINFAINEIAYNYNSSLELQGNAEFYRYILSMKRKVLHTSNIIISSSHLHFILHASTLSQEHIVCFQILTILYLYPLASIDIFVIDVKWFYRHHYSFITILKNAGYIRVDPFNPIETEKWQNVKLKGNSFINIRSSKSLLIQLSTLIVNNATNISNSDLFIPSWNPITVFLPINQAFIDPFHLFDYISYSLTNEELFIIDLNKDNKELNNIAKIGIYYNPNNVEGGIYLQQFLFIADLLQLDLPSSLKVNNFDLPYHLFEKNTNEINIYVKTICSLLEIRVESQSDNHKNDFIDQILNSPPWLLTLNILKSSEAINNICMT